MLRTASSARLIALSAGEQNGGRAANEPLLELKLVDPSKPAWRYAEVSNQE